MAVVAFANYRCRRTELQIETRVEYVQRPFPEASVAILFPVANDATFYLVDLFKTAVLHDERENFAANTTSAIRNDWFVLDVVVFAALKLCDEVTR